MSKRDLWPKLPSGRSYYKKSKTDSTLEPYYSGASNHGTMKHNMFQGPTSDQFEEAFDVCVGTGTKARTWKLHKGVLSDSSQYFEAALKKDGFKEGRANRVDLPKEDPQIFQEFIAWSYTRDFNAHEEERVLDNKQKTKETKITFLVRMWIFADAFLVNDLGNKAMEKMFYQCRWSEITDFDDALRTAYEGTTEGSELRRWLIDLYSAAHGTDLVKDRYLKWPAEILWDILARMEYALGCYELEFMEIDVTEYFDNWPR